MMMTQTLTHDYTDFIISGKQIPQQRIVEGANDVNAGTETLRVWGLDGFDNDVQGVRGIAGKVNGDLAFELSEAKGLVGGANFDHEAMWSVNNNKTLVGGGIYLNWEDEEMTFGDNLLVRPNATDHTEFAKDKTTTLETDTIDLDSGVFGSNIGWQHDVGEVTVDDLDALRFRFRFNIGTDSSRQWRLRVLVQAFDGSSWENIDKEVLDPTFQFRNASTSFRTIPGPLTQWELNESPYRLQFQSSSSMSPGDNSAGHLFIYAFPDTKRFTQYRIRLQFWPTDNNGTWNADAELQEHEIRTWGSVMELNNGGLWSRDSDVHIGRMTAAGVKQFLDHDLLEF